MVEVKATSMNEVATSTAVPRPSRTTRCSQINGPESRAVRARDAVKYAKNGM